MLEMKRKLKAMEKAMQDVVEHWEDVDEETHKQLTNDYPFNQSLDELTHELSMWVKSL
ncbi:hypothetical protein [Halobacillus litoralis]|uniref:hypothetical protein n=1 Tax=Halobacillus litoralis TaxID=45668 RepID=UPI0013E8A4A0|nr:hypothetical protein [Halobacillus litoralis]